MKNQVGERIKTLRLSLGMTQEELGNKVGVKRAAINKYETGVVYNIKRDMQIKLADALGVDPAWLFYDDSSDSSEKTLKAVRIPVLGRVQAGLPIDVQEEIIDWEEITPELAARGKFFGLKVKGDSMAPRILEGDVVIIRQQDDAECEDIVIAMVNGDEATIKKLIKYTTGGIALVAANPLYPPLQFTEEDIITKPVKILGKVVELRRKF